MIGLSDWQWRVLWLQGAVCRPQDILPQDEGEGGDDVCSRLAAILVTVTRLLTPAPSHHPSHHPHATDNHEPPQEDTHNIDSQLQPDSAEQLNFRDIKIDQETFVDFKTNQQTFGDFNSDQQNHPEELHGDEEPTKTFDDGDNSAAAKFRDNLNYFQNKPTYRNRYAEDRCISNFNAMEFSDVPDSQQTFPQDSNNFVVNRIDNIHFQNNNAESSADNNKMTNFDTKRMPFSQTTYSYNNIEKNKINFVVPLMNGAAKPPSPKKMNISPDESLAKTFGNEDANQSIIRKRVKFFNDKRNSLNLDIKNNLNTMQTESMAVSEQDRVVSWFCVGIFLSTLVFLYVFPLPY